VRLMLLWWVSASVVGGLWARWRGWVWCARVPGLISVRDRGSVGDVMGDGVFA
jgi:hypothetical protein